MKEWVEWILLLLFAFLIALMLFGAILSTLDWVMDVMKKLMRGAHKKEDDE